MAFGGGAVGNRDHTIGHIFRSILLGGGEKSEKGALGKKETLIKGNYDHLKRSTAPKASPCIHH